MEISFTSLCGENTILGRKGERGRGGGGTSIGSQIMFSLLQGSFTVPVDLSQLWDTPPAPLPHHSSSPSSKLPGTGGEGCSVLGLLDEGRGRSSGEESRPMGTRREAKRKLLDALEPFTPKRRSSRVSRRLVCSL